MRIDLNRISLEQISQSKIEREDQARKASGKGPAAPNVEDKASLSVDALSVSSLAAQALSAPSVRQDKVDALRQAVQSGEYKPDAEKTAQAILEQNKR